ncbi:hypothetical protein TARUN_1481 [Trichoderma arundinaceum]|uniref:Uncharacterized protein n=1 Tax=Trichoderma arundinaceum TaxID=490622 RepID=A0A395NX72_TRIAR|nr:hypothetical protein TARUN_1481 [Trichoderma arundinaceum]
MAASLPNWIRMSAIPHPPKPLSILLVLSLFSFFPQLRELWLRRNASGISPYYVLFHLISATELFALAFFFVVNTPREEPPASDAFVHKPPQPGDYLNLAQMALVWVLWLIVFAAVLLLPSQDSSHHPGHRYGISGHNGQGNNTNGSASARNPATPIVLPIYIAFLFISLIPVVVDAAWPSHDADYHKWGLALFHGAHAFFIYPIIVTLILASFFPQRNQILQHPPGTPSSSLSLIGLAVQAVVFALLAMSWIWRLVFPWDEFVDGDPLFYGLWTWYQTVGFVPVDHAAFALVQAALLAVAILHQRPWFAGGESESLLANQH